MQYQLRLSDAGENYSCVLTLDEDDVRQAAIDVVFDLIGSPDVENLIAAGKLPAGQSDELKSIQKVIFDHDADGAFIKESVQFKGNGKEINPDAPIKNSFTPSERDGLKYFRLDLVAIDSSAPQSASKSNQGQISAAANSSAPQGQEEIIRDLSRAMLLHQIGIGTNIDVTKDNTEIEDLIAWAEKDQLIEIDVKTAGYKLTERGKRTHDSYIEEAQNLIKKFDIYGDVDVDRSGTAHFDSGAGRDFRVAAFEMEGVDPFRARFLLGLNDGEWDKLSNWNELVKDISFYEQIFAPIEQALSVEEIGEDKMASVIEQGKAKLRG